jgi:DNA-directed RNA polymerase subunit RPC12/RpoP
MANRSEGIGGRCTRFIEGMIVGLPQATAGQVISCPYCSGKHMLQGVEQGGENGGVLIYWCGSNLRIGGLAGRLVVDNGPRNRAVL